jgi:hypothetical protein
VYPFEAVGLRELGFAFENLPLCASTTTDDGNVHLKEKREMSHRKEMWRIAHLNHIALIGLDLRLLANLRRISESNESKCVTMDPTHGPRQLAGCELLSESEKAVEGPGR